jgi:hypothetical protein
MLETGDVRHDFRLGVHGVHFGGGKAELLDFGVESLFDGPGYGCTDLVAKAHVRWNLKVSQDNTYLNAD